MATYAVRTVAGDLLIIPALQRRLLFRMIQDIMLMLNRERARHEADPGAGMLDSQTAKAPHVLGAATTRPTKRLKRHVAVDTDGRLLMVNPTPADVRDVAKAE